jgi:hypothetical protein
LGNENEPRPHPVSRCITLHDPARGRGGFFDERDHPDGKRVVIVSAAIERTYFPYESAVGHEVKFGEERFEIMGVVGNIRRAGLRDEPRADMSG